jgi:hypothetical protein
MHAEHVTGRENVRHALVIFPFLGTFFLVGFVWESVAVYQVTVTLF